MRAQDGGERRAGRRPRKMAERVEHWQVGLGRAEVLDRAAARDRDAGGFRLFEQRIEQPRLADAGLAGDEQRPPGAADGVRQRRAQHRQRRVAADQRQRRLCAGQLPAARGRRCAEEPIAAPVHGGDEARRLGRVAEGVADLADAGLQRAVANRRVRPRCIEQRILRYQPSALGEQALQHRRRLRRQRDELGAAPQCPAGLLEAKLAEVPLLGHPHRFCSTAADDAGNAAAESAAQHCSRVEPLVTSANRETLVARRRPAPDWRPESDERRESAARCNLV